MYIGYAGECRLGRTSRDGSPGLFITFFYHCFGFKWRNRPHQLSQTNYCTRQIFICTAISQIYLIFHMFQFPFFFHRIIPFQFIYRTCQFKLFSSSGSTSILVKPRKSFTGLSICEFLNPTYICATSVPHFLNQFYFIFVKHKTIFSVATYAAGIIIIHIF